MQRGARRCANAFVALAAAFAGAAGAQSIDCNTLRPGVPSDYYAARGCGLLASVEQFHLGPGQEHLRSRRYQSAFGDFKFILAQFPNHPNALILIAATCTQWPPSERDRSGWCSLDESFDQAIRINPNVAGTYLAIGIYRHRAGNYAAAITAYKRALELEPDSQTAHYNLGLSYVETKQYDLANQEAQQAYALGATLPGLRSRLEKAGKWKPQDSASKGAAAAGDAPVSAGNKDRAAKP